MQGASALWRCAQRSWRPARWPWTRWTCAAGPSMWAAPKDMSSPLRWGPNIIASAHHSCLRGLRVCDTGRHRLVKTGHKASMVLPW